MSRELSDCHHDLKVALIELMADAKRELPNGDVAVIAQTYRSNADQLAAWQCGRDADGNIIDKSKIITYAKPGASKHNCLDTQLRPCSRAADILIVRHGRVVGDKDDPSYEILGTIGKNLGLEWSGDWKKSFEAAHFQLKDSVC